MRVAMMKRIVMAAAVAAASPAMATFVVSVEAPKASTTTTTFTSSGVESFESRATGSNQTFTDGFGPITAVYTGVNVVPNDQYGGAAGSARYATTNSGSGYTIDVTNSAGAVNYFGYYLSALNSGNTVSFYSAGALVASYDVASLSTTIGSGYNGNPSTNENMGEKYAFLNFYDQGGTFDRVTIAGSGHESDNHTFGAYSSYTGTILSGSVPEPAAWTVMILGFGMIGSAMRRRRAEGRAGIV